MLVDGLGGQLGAGPARQGHVPLGWWGAGQGLDLDDLNEGEKARASGPGQITKPGQLSLDEAFSPFAHGVDVQTQVGGDDRVHLAVGGGHDDSGADDVAVRMASSAADRMITKGEEITMCPFVPCPAQTVVAPRRIRCGFWTGWATMRAMAKIPESTKSSLHQRLSARARDRWPQISRIDMRYRAGFAYIDAVLADGEVLPLCRLRYAGYANQWGFAIYRASHQDYQDSYLPTGSMGGTAEHALDTACGLYLNDPTAWT